MSDKVSRFPTTYWQRMKNRRGNRAVNCIVTDRWLRFEEEAGETKEGPIVRVEVLTDANEREHRICELFIPLEELARAVSNVKLKE